MQWQPRIWTTCNLQRILRQWGNTQRDTGESLKGKEQTLPIFCAKETALMILKQVQATDNTEILVFQKSRWRNYRQVKTRVLPNHLRNSRIQKPTYEDATMLSHWHSHYSPAQTQTRVWNCLLLYLPSSSCNLHQPSTTCTGDAAHPLSCPSTTRFGLPAPQHPWALVLAAASAGEQDTAPTDKYFGFYKFSPL